MQSCFLGQWHSQDSKLLVPVFYFAELVETSLWSIWSKKHALFTQLLSKATKKKKTDVHTTAKEYLRTYGPNIYAVVSGHSCYVCFYVIRIPIQISFGISFQELWRFVCNNGTFLKNTKSSADTKINKSDVCNQRGVWQTKHSFELQSLFLRFY